VRSFLLEQRARTEIAVAERGCKTARCGGAGFSAREALDPSTQSLNQRTTAVFMEAPLRHRLGLVLLAAAASVACSEPTFGSDRAASLITGLDQFKREAHFTIHTGVPLQSAFQCISQAEVDRTPLNQFLVERGWVRYETREAILGFGTKASCPAIALTPAGEAASAQWIRGRGASSEGTAWAVPIGRRELLGVTGLTTAPDGSAQVEFDWKWTPNETGTALRKSVRNANVFFDQAKKGRATCRQSDDGWQCQLGMWMTPADALGEFPP
jgi:hypothetical protein